MTFNVDAVFQAEFTDAIARDVEKSGFMVKHWFMNGRAKPETAVETWRERGPLLVTKFIDWWETSGMQVWVTPDGRPAIELELRPRFGDIEVVMYVDLIAVGPHGLYIIDTKSGYKKPDSLQQIGMYACGVEKVYGIRPFWGGYCNLRQDDIFKPVPLTGYQFSAEFFTAELAMFEQGVESGIFVASVGAGCARCGVAYACKAVGGMEADHYDPANQAIT